MCKKIQRCGFCADSSHSTRDCNSKEDNTKHYCALCGGKAKHTAWDKACPIRIQKTKEAVLAYQTRPQHFQESTYQPPKHYQPTPISTSASAPQQSSIPVPSVPVPVSISILSPSSPLPISQPLLQSSESLPPSTASSLLSASASLSQRPRVFQGPRTPQGLRTPQGPRTTQDIDPDQDQDQDQDQDNQWQIVNSKRPRLSSPEGNPHFTKRGRGRPRGSTRASQNTRDIRSFSRTARTETTDYTSTPAPSL
jgi:hypothetical protein